eukprot:682185_1
MHVCTTRAEARKRPGAGGVDAGTAEVHSEHSEDQAGRPDHHASGKVGDRRRGHPARLARPGRYSIGGGHGAQTVPQSEELGEGAAGNGPRQSDSTPTRSRVFFNSMSSSLIHGDDDRLVTFSESQRLARQLKNSEIVKIEQCGHIPHAERPSEFVDELTHFLSRVRAFRASDQHVVRPMLEVRGEEEKCPERFP